MDDDDQNSDDDSSFGWDERLTMSVPPARSIHSSGKEFLWIRTTRSAGHLFTGRLTRRWCEHHSTTGLVSTIGPNPTTTIR